MNLPNTPENCDAWCVASLEQCCSVHIFRWRRARRSFPTRVYARFTCSKTCILLNDCGVSFSAMHHTVFANGNVNWIPITPNIVSRERYHILDYIIIPIVSVGASISLMAHVTWSGAISHSYNIDARNRNHHAWRATYTYRRVQQKTSLVSISSIFLRCCVVAHGLVKTFRPRQNGNHFPDDVLKCFFLNENVWILDKISQYVLPYGVQLTKCQY